MPSTLQILVLRCLEAHCSDGQLLVDLFVNYDCDLDNSNLFERMVMALKGKALGHGSEKESEKVTQQEATLRLEALRCLVNIVAALEMWYQKKAPGDLVVGLHSCEFTQFVDILMYNTLLVFTFLWKR